MTRAELREYIRSKSRVSKTGCWLWRGVPQSRGYAQPTLEKKRLLAHRLSYEAFVGPIGDKYVLHTCDVRLCVNPEHLFLGTAADNSRDMRLKGRSAKGERVGSAKLTEEAVREIRRATASDEYLAKKYGVHSDAISRVRNKTTWSHVDT